DTGTTHISVVDGDGNAVALTQTIGYHYGAGITVPGRGIVLNNVVENFQRDPRIATPSANFAGGGKRPRTAILPTIILDRGGSRPVRW
ncbi:gamma-glutamyltransferase, partial [Helicobacter pylori]|uniref:gamma-glutamyltransferase n=1 Tax=Helicobacter pylori TaxID=210 RepID=UPI002928E797